MIATLPTQERVDQVARELAPDVIRIRMDVGHDWTEHPAIYFRVMLSDDVTLDRLSEVTTRVEQRLTDELGLEALEHSSHFRYRDQSEQAKLQDKAWD
jgi:hypothetical protein